MGVTPHFFNKTAPDLSSVGVYDLIFLNLEENNFPLNTVKLYVIYPNSKNLVKVINECEMVFIKPNVDIYGSRVNNYSDLEQNINQF